jgi:hypothetical protein
MRTWAIAALSLCLLALVLTAFDAESEGPAPVRIGAPVEAQAAGPRARVAYTGPRRLEGIATLRARVRPGGARIVAVTFRLGGRTLGTDTRPPYRLDVDAARLRTGRAAAPSG